MKKYINGRLVEMTSEEIEKMLADQLSQEETIPLEDRIAALEEALTALLEGAIE